MKPKVYIYGLCDVFYDGYYIKGLNEIFENIQFSVSKFPDFAQGTFAFIIEEDNGGVQNLIIDSKDSSQIDKKALEWCSVYGKANYNIENLETSDKAKIIAIGPSFGIQIWNLLETVYHLILNFIRFRDSISHKREFMANYWRQYKRFALKKYKNDLSSGNYVFFMNSIWKQEPETNKNRALFIESCKDNTNVSFEGGFAARKDGNNLGLDALVYSERISLAVYLKKIKKSAFVFNTPAVLSCHGWKLAEFLALGKAIITTPHYNILPADLLDNKHVLYVNNSNDIKEAINKLTTNVDLRRKLERESREYFDKYLAPEKVITRLLEKI
ncbi:hypothetical protein C8C83_2651 [Flavobacterium sp. 90]|uniref:glycosyltransferase n=1 Tax=Flavobacterium sp. 90 TaxID=2135622 RepID=UPI001051A067|nr:glycosyltransferase family 1 protein [Flavobacterium sp. 90]TCK54741.1 hypothetical protein C8C83_2651 [Flavobacterium sp. 90]